MIFTCGPSTTKFNKFCKMFPPTGTIVDPTATNANVKLNALLGRANTSRENVIRVIGQMSRPERVLYSGQNKDG